MLKFKRLKKQLILNRPLYKKNPLEITKQSSSTCNISIFSPLTFNTDERRVGIPLIDLTPPYLYACPKIVPILNYERIV
jgi:hypothetical protein